LFSILLQVDVEGRLSDALTFFAKTAAKGSRGRPAPVVLRASLVSEVFDNTMSVL
jgi:hypothetical protein